MIIPFRHLGLTAMALGLFAVASPSAYAVSMAECSAKWKAAKADGSAAGTTWTDFRKANCGADTPAAAAAAPAAAPAPVAAPAAAPKPAAPAAPAAAAGPAVYPTAVDAKYASLTPGKQRFKTCLDQYHANQATNGNGGLTWIHKGDSYYSECNKRLKGGA